MDTDLDFDILKSAASLCVEAALLVVELQYCDDRAIRFAAEDLVQRMTELEVRLQQCRVEAAAIQEAQEAGAHAGDSIPG